MSHLRLAPTISPRHLPIEVIRSWSRPSGRPKRRRNGTNSTCRHDIELLVLIHPVGILGRGRSLHRIGRHLAQRSIARGSARDGRGVNSRRCVILGWLAAGLMNCVILCHRINRPLVCSLAHAHRVVPRLPLYTPCLAKTTGLQSVKLLARSDHRIRPRDAPTRCRFTPLRAAGGAACGAASARPC